MNDKTLSAVKPDTYAHALNDQTMELNAIEHLEATFASLSDAFSAITLRAYRSDLKAFVGWCEKNDLIAFPAEPEAVAAFIEEEAFYYKAATLSRRIAAISKAQRLFGFSTIGQAPAVDLALRRCRRRLGTRQQQAVGLTAAKIDQIKSVLGWSVCDIRDRLLLALGYETLCRRSELVALSIGQVERFPTGEGSILVVRSKADPFGAGRRAFLSKGTLLLLDRWTEASGVQDAAILRSLRRGCPYDALHAASVPRILKQLSRRAGFPGTVVMGISGHSLRVGAAQDMAAAGVSLPAIMQAGGWKSAEMVLRYIEYIDVQRSGMAQLLQQKGSR